MGVQLRAEGGMFTLEDIAKIFGLTVYTVRTVNAKPVAAPPCWRDRMVTPIIDLARFEWQDDDRQ